MIFNYTTFPIIIVFTFNEPLSYLNKYCSIGFTVLANYIYPDFLIEYTKTLGFSSETTPKTSQNGHRDSAPMLEDKLPEQTPGAHGYSIPLHQDKMMGLYYNRKICNFDQTYVDQFFGQLRASADEEYLEFAKSHGTIYHFDKDPRDFTVPNWQLLCRSEDRYDFCPPLENSHIVPIALDENKSFCVYFS